MSDIVRTAWSDSAGARLSIDLDAIASNFRFLRSRLGQTECGAVVKADAYGLGAGQVAPVLYAAGCRTFFVAHLDEGVALRSHLPDGVAIYVMHGLFPGSERECFANGLIPVLNTPGQSQAWASLARRLERRLAAALQIDTGMSRFGLSTSELNAAADTLATIDLRLVMSHLACADMPAHPANERQRVVFDDLRRRLPSAPASLSASSGTFLPQAYHYDLARPGAALFGVAPVGGLPNPLRPVVRLDARIVQLRTVPADTPVGYGHTAMTSRESRLATVAVGYADGYLRSGGNRGAAWIGEFELPILGRISMDSIVLDASSVPAAALFEGAWVELIGPHRDVDAVASDAGTIGYEVLTGLGHRYDRRHLAVRESLT